MNTEKSTNPNTQEAANSQSSDLNSLVNSLPSPRNYLSQSAYRAYINFWSNVGDVLNGTTDTLLADGFQVEIKRFSKFNSNKE